MIPLPTIGAAVKPGFAGDRPRVPIEARDSLDSITIPVACPVSWNEMHGDHRTRFCDQCSQNVHDVSELTKAEALELITGGEKIPCLRLYRRQDGRVMTADCATKRERVWKWLHRRSTWVAALFALVFMGCADSERTFMTGVPCLRPDSPYYLDSPYDLRPSAVHEDEHLPRSASGGDHSTSASPMDEETRKDASFQHEAAVSE